MSTVGDQDDRPSHHTINTKESETRLRISPIAVKLKAMSNVKNNMEHTSTALHALGIAEYFVASVDTDSGDNITHLKLQKLLYYAQGFHVAMCDGKTLFPESLLAWAHGPVVRKVYNRYRGQAYHPIDPNVSFSRSHIPPEIREILDAVYATYGQFSATKLEKMTHEESPWQETEPSSVISLDLLRNYFVPLVEAGRRNKCVKGRPIWPMTSFKFQGRKELAMSRQSSMHRSRLKAMSLHGSIDGD